MRELHDILMDLHTIPTKTKGDNPMDRIANAGAEIEQFVIKARIEELERFTCHHDHTFIPGFSIDKRIEELKKGLQGK